MKTFSDYIESRNTKQLFIMRGISGSGKSTLAQSLKNQLGGVVFSTDDFFTDDQGVYKFDVSLLGVNHQKNVDRTEGAMKMGVTPIIIDNTNTQSWEMKPYVVLAQKYGYEVKIKQPGDSDFPEVDFDELMRRQSARANQGKNLSPEVITKMMQRFQPTVSVDDIMKSKSPFK